MKALEFITGHMVYNLAYTSILQTTATFLMVWTFTRKTDLYDGATERKQMPWA